MDESAFDKVNEFVSSNSIKQFSPKTSVVVKVVDEQRAAHFLHPLSSYVPSKKYIPLEDRDQYKYTEQSSGRLVQDAIPESAKELQQTAKQGMDSLFKFN